MQYNGLLETVHLIYVPKIKEIVQHLKNLKIHWTFKHKINIIK